MYYAYFYLYEAHSLILVCVRELVWSTIAKNRKRR